MYDNIGGWPVHFIEHDVVHRTISIAPSHPYAMAAIAASILVVMLVVSQRLGRRAVDWLTGEVAERWAA